MCLCKPFTEVYQDCVDSVCGGVPYRHLLTLSPPRLKEDSSFTLNPYTIIIRGFHAGYS